MNNDVFQRRQALHNDAIGDVKTGARRRPGRRLGFLSCEGHLHDLFP